MWDYLIVGAGLFGSVFAFEVQKRGKKVLVIEKRNHIGGNCYTEKFFNPNNPDEFINVHLYGAHIFHTSNKKVWEYIQQFAEFNHFINAPLANFQGEIYNLPFNMHTFHQLWGVTTPSDAQAIIQKQRAAICGTPRNLEEQAIALVGTDIYEKLIRGYTQKQWGRACRDLPAEIIKRLPVRFTFNNNYFNDPFQGIPQGGYTAIFEKLLKNCEVQLNTDFLKNKAEFLKSAQKIIYTGTIDGFFDYEFGKLEYRSLSFEHEFLNCENFQGVAVMNFTDLKTPFTRIIEHKHFEFGEQNFSVISREYPQDFNNYNEPYYPINDFKNNALYKKYLEKAKNFPNIIFAGRLGSYQYLNMDQIIERALFLIQQEFGD